MLDNAVRVDYPRRTTEANGSQRKEYDFAHQRTRAGEGQSRTPTPAEKLAREKAPNASESTVDLGVQPSFALRA